MINVEFWGCGLKFCNNFWKFGCQPQKSKANLWTTEGSKDLIYLSFLLFPKDLQSQIKQNFKTVYHKKICLTFLSLAAKLSEITTKFQGCSLKIEHWSSFDLNGLKNGPSLHFKKYPQINALCQRLMGAMICR